MRSTRWSVLGEIFSSSDSPWPGGQEMIGMGDDAVLGRKVAHVVGARLDVDDLFRPPPR